MTSWFAWSAPPRRDGGSLGAGAVEGVVIRPSAEHAALPSTRGAARLRWQRELLNAKDSSLGRRAHRRGRPFCLGACA